jgi:hypothetical protein
MRDKMWCEVKRGESGWNGVKKEQRQRKKVWKEKWEMGMLMRLGDR